ncbi:MAG TPA: hypothetical protein VFM98_05185 [Ramlibacter sp.]|uniref:hypothetical protein n=1 Tax=Ramlibacter sp. TaxID=1917967 RepID=UPI002D7F5521|nr:hypothetical protein [Ramlibacter sp.]HET8744973.1 hypothetical protein [Ramlibacter sp.]
MPHPKNRLKLTGDTHLPDIADLLDEADEVELTVVEVAPQRVYADGWVPPSQAEMEMEMAAESAMAPGPVLQVERGVQRQVAARPWLMMAAALGFGFVVAKMLRR